MKLVSTAAILVALVSGCGDSAGPSAKSTTLVFTVQPTATVLGHVISPAIQVTVQDENGTRAQSTESVTVALGANSGGAVLSGSLTEVAVNGVATFPNLFLRRAAAGYTLTVAATGLTGAESTPFTVHGFTTLSAGNRATCGLMSDGKAYCWGWNEYGTLGDGSAPTGPTDCDGRSFCSPVPVAVSGGLNLMDISARGGHACGVTTGGAVHCWGYNDRGQVGVASPRITPAPVAVGGGLTFMSVRVGAGHSCGLTAAGTAYCWGSNHFGPLGNGTTSDTPTPMPVSGGLTFASIHPGGLHTCGLTTAGAAYCWGLGQGGALGDSGTVVLPECEVLGPQCSTTPIAVRGGFTFTTMSAAGSHTCALTADGTAYCWGPNNFGQIGDGTTTSRAYPVPVSGGLTFASLSGGGYGMCGLTGAGKAYCWGNNGNDNSPIPAAVPGQYVFLSLAAGFEHRCGVVSGGLVYCWGNNFYGQLGNGTLVDRSTPDAVIYP